jgi:hypothetical protein
MLDLVLIFLIGILFLFFMVFLLIFFSISSLDVKFNPNHFLNFLG